MLFMLIFCYRNHCEVNEDVGIYSSLCRVMGLWPAPHLHWSFSCWGHLGIGANSDLTVTVRLGQSLTVCSLIMDHSGVVWGWERWQTPLLHPRLWAVCNNHFCVHQSRSPGGESLHHGGQGGHLFTSSGSPVALWCTSGGWLRGGLPPLSSQWY